MLNTAAEGTTYTSDHIDTRRKSQTRIQPADIVRFLEKDLHYSCSIDNVVLFGTGEVPAKSNLDEMLAEILSSIQGKVFVAYGSLIEHDEVTAWVAMARSAGAKLACGYRTADLFPQPRKSD